MIKPEGNRVKGKLKGSKDRRHELARLIKEDQDKRRYGILGNVRKEKPQPRKALRKSGAARAHSITGVVFLKAVYKGKEYRATLQSEGTVKFNGTTYSSLSAAGRSITQRATNGRHFWRARDASKQWVRLYLLRP